MFAAIRLPAARRFAGTILRATITGSVNFIAILALGVLNTGEVYCGRYDLNHAAKRARPSASGVAGAKPVSASSARVSA